MKKNKLYIFIILLIAVLIFSTAALCNECEETSGSTITTSPPDTTPIHGVVPTKVTGSTHNNSKDIAILDFWNVGELGGNLYYDAFLQKNGETFGGRFTGGPDGEFFLSSNNSKLHGKLVDGKQFISDDGDVLEIDNPQAFDGWTDESAEQTTTESSEQDETTTEPATTTTGQDANLIHGVMPTKVTGTSEGTGKSGWIGILEFWNVGELGGEKYSKATYIMSLDGKTTSTWEGYFTGGPNGEIFLSGKDGELHGKLVDGKQLVGDTNGIVDIDNPEAFDGWIE